MKPQRAHKARRAGLHRRAGSYGYGRRYRFWYGYRTVYRSTGAMLRSTSFFSQRCGGERFITQHIIIHFPTIRLLSSAFQADYHVDALFAADGMMMELSFQCPTKWWQSLHPLAKTAIRGNQRTPHTSIQALFLARSLIGGFARSFTTAGPRCCFRRCFMLILYNEMTLPWRMPPMAPCSIGFTVPVTDYHCTQTT